ncbi:LysR substrate-binding domain-containing protein [Urechidicola vernalis]|uniref:LysR substrate-binding domain-containing protein n=1 Tax=Urechidicola vernalis TaxID=3075600 RepID=A0ABU2Y6F5_9FLAO|nr:LysR substrate-binding domain-containing protein [Urechidicola sp. P050]MDT0553771.1 LysR substrate-binding domain-containing protein [Urechidicola sp. P050]
MELRHIHYFLAVAEDLHFRKAAERLFISQPGLSRQIKQLEEELGFPLFERSNKKVSLTKAGNYLKNEFVLTLKNINDSVQHAQLLNQGIEGNINLGYVGSAMQNVIPSLLHRINENLPNLHYNLKEMENPEQIDALLTQEIDLAFVRMNQVPSGLKIKPIFEDTFSLVLPKNHPINQSNFKNLSQFKNEQFILFDQSYSPNYYAQVMQIFSDSGFIPSISHNTVHASTIFKLVENNFGIAIVPSTLQLGYQMNIKFIELKKIKQRTVLSVAWNASNRNPILENILKLI